MIKGGKTDSAAFENNIVLEVLKTLRAQNNTVNEGPLMHGVYELPFTIQCKVNMKNCPSKTIRFSASLKLRSAKTILL